jgi:hypothetical protein
MRPADLVMESETTAWVVFIPVLQLTPLVWDT